MQEPVWTPDTSGRNRLSGIVRDIVAAMALVRVTVDCGVLLSAVVIRSALSELQVATGKPIIAAIKASGVQLIARQEG
jgi:molybdopterin-binding protein